MWDEATAAAYDDDMAAEFAPQVVDPAVDLLAELAGSGRALGFAIGTGRLGVPLAHRGVPVAGIELSPAMAAQLRRKVDEATLPIVIGDMATTRVPGEFSLVWLPFNSISNLRTQAEQVACFRNAARHLRPGGRFVIELWVPALRRMPPGPAAVTMAVSETSISYDTYDVATQQCTSHSYWRTAAGAVRHDSGRFRYVWAPECDLMAQLAGLELEERYAGWDRRPFTSESDSHVSIWRRGTD